MKNILVTGGAGYIGSHIVEELVKKNFLKIFIVDDLSTGHKRLINKKATFIKANINKTQLIKKIILKNKIDTIIHLAAKTIVTESEKKPKLYYKANVLGTSSLLDAAKNSSVKNFLFSSTAAVYGSKIRYANEKSKTSQADAFNFSGCLDPQTSADAFIRNQSQGAFTSCFFEFVNNNSTKDANNKMKFNTNKIRLSNMLKEINCRLVISGFNQRPLLSMGKVNDFNRLFTP